MIVIKALLTVTMSKSLPMYPATEPCRLPPLNGSATCNASLDVEARLDDLVTQLMTHASLAERAGLLQNTAGAVDSLNIAAYNWWFGKCSPLSTFTCNTQSVPQTSPTFLNRIGTKLCMALRVKAP